MHYGPHHAAILEQTHTHTSTLSHTHTLKLPGSDSRCELGPQRVIIDVSIIELTNSSKACFILISLPFPARFNGGMTLSFYRPFLEELQFVLRCFSAGCRQSHGRRLKRSLHADSEAALCCFNRVRQFQGNNSFGQWASSSGGHRGVSVCAATKGFINVLTVILRPRYASPLSHGDDLITTSRSPQRVYAEHTNSSKR